jgi:hypothetical protein
MQKRVWLGLILLGLPVAHLLGWVSFRNRHHELAMTSPDAFNRLYLESLPEWLRSLYPTQVVVISILLLLCAGWIFARQSQSRYLLLAVLAFILAGWEGVYWLL